MKSLRLHPAFIAICIALIFLSKLELLTITIFCVLLHEGAHALCARLFGYRLSTLTLMPYGAVLCGEDNLHDNDAFFIAIVGPLSNLLLAVITICLWWIFPESYSFTLIFCRVNIALALFNMLPFYPLDGGRIVLSFAKNKLIALKRLRLWGIVGSFIFMALFITSAFFKINFTLGVISITLFLGASSGTEKQKYVEICNFLSHFKDYTYPIERCELLVNHNMTLQRLIMSLSSKKIYTVQVVDNSLQTLCILENDDLDKLISYPNKKERIKDILSCCCGLS